MQSTTLGRTGLTVTVGGLGCGGHSRLGIDRGIDHAAGIVRAAYDAGVTFFDTATVYGTQSAVGTGLAGIGRDRYVLSTKFPYRDGNAGIRKADDLVRLAEESLRELKTDYIDIYHLHGVAPADYPAVRDTFVPVMQQLKQAGKIRFLGITEVFGMDTAHEMFKTALPEDLFDVIMTGYNLLNPSAAKRVLPITREKNVGVLCMFAVRKALSNTEQLAIDIGRILNKGQADPALINRDAPLDFLTGEAASIMEAAYRFCRHTPGIDVVLTGTGNADHLRDNLASIEKPPLSRAILEKIEALFGNVDCVSGQ
jgi:aryl-alcohol dehydrogenase-like predicted oxidoreductase